METHIPWYGPEMTGGERDLLARVIESNHPNQGSMTAELETKIAALLNVKHAIATTSGTVAMFLALKALGIGPGDEVIVPDITFIATANAVRLTGAAVVLADVDPTRLTLDPAAFERAITPRTRAVMPVHVTGRAADMNTILEIARKKNISVVEDAAEAFASKYQGAYLGTLGSAGCFSFSAMKIVTSGQGGMVVTNDDAFALAMRGVRNHGITGRGTGGDDLHPSLGFNFKFTDVQAAFLLAQLEALPTRIESSRRRHVIYRDALRGLDRVSLYPFDLENGELPLWTDVALDDQVTRDALEATLKHDGMECRRYWHPIHRQAPYKDTDEAYPNAVNGSYRSLWLPSAFFLRDEDVHRVCDAIRAFFNS